MTDIEKLRSDLEENEVIATALTRIVASQRAEIEKLNEEVRLMRESAVPRDEYGLLIDEVDRLREVLRVVTDHFAAVMGGPLIAGNGVTFENGVEGIPTIARARAVLGESK